MKLNDAGVTFIASLEGKSNKAYCLEDGGITIGYGHYFSNQSKEVLTKKITNKTVWTDKQCLNDFKNLLKFYEGIVSRETSVMKLSQNQFNALVSYSYNRGIGGLKQLLTASKKKPIATGMLMLVYWGSNKTYEKSLKNRRLKEVELYFKNFCPSHKKITKESDVNLIAWIQLKLGIDVDGIWGTKTSNALKKQLKKTNDSVNRNDIIKLSKM